MKNMSTFFVLVIAATRSFAFTSRLSRTSLQQNSAKSIASTDWTVLHHRSPSVLTRRYFSTENKNSEDGVVPSFKSGDKIQVEVISFGPLGASVEVIACGHEADDLISEDQPALGRGLILQKEIAFFRQGRNNIDVVRGEVLPAYVERVRENGRIDISLRAYGGKAKADEVSQQILDRLEMTSGGVLEVGDKSPPEVIAREFPGVSKNSFKRAVANLYKAGKVKPGPDSITLIQ